MGSALGGQNDRKMSTQTRRASTKDPRPVSEKQFILESSRKVVAFLNEHGYEEQITVKNLQSPAVKVYAGILQFCFRFIDPNFTFKGQYDEEIPAMFRSIEYPINIQKSALKAISQHHWPGLLAALTWLVELLQWEEMRMRQKEEMVLTVDGEDTEAIFFDYLSEAYQMFMSGADDTSELDNRLAAQFEEKNGQIEEECGQLQRSINTLQKDIARLEEQAMKLPNLRKKKQTYQVDIEKFNDLVSQFEDYIGKIQRKLSANEKDLSAKKKRLDSLLKEKESLQQRLDAQEASGVDYRQMMQVRMDLEEKVAQLRSSREMAAKMMGEHEICLNKLLEVVEADVLQYTELAMRVKLLPHTHNTKLKDVNFDLQFKSHAKAEEMIGVDLKLIRSTLKKYRSSLAASNKTASAEAIQLQEQLDKLQDQSEMKKDDLLSLQLKVENQEHALEVTKEALEEDQRQLKLTAKNIRDETESLLKMGLSRLQQSHQAVDNLRVEEKKLKAQFVQASDSLNNSIIDVCDRLTNHKQYIQLRLMELKEFAEITSKEIAAMDSVVLRQNLNKSSAPNV